LHSHDFAKAMLTAGGLMMRSVAASNSEGREAVVLNVSKLFVLFFLFLFNSLIPTGFGAGIMNPLHI